MEVYLEIEDVKYGRMIAELFENLSEGCLDELLNHKNESLKQARIIGRVIALNDPITNEEAKLLKANGFHIRMKVYNIII